MILQLVSPIDGSVIDTRPTATPEQIANALNLAEAAQRAWKRTPLQERVELCRRFCDLMVSRKAVLGQEIALQMGRPLRYAPKELESMAERASVMADLARDALANLEVSENRFVCREPVGVVLAIAPWNYPYLTAVNVVVPALLAGNAVLLKHSPQTLLCGDRLEQAFLEAGFPTGLFQHLILANEEAAALVRSPRIQHVSFTGSVGVGLQIQALAASRIGGLGLELGGKDPAYVRADANLDHAIAELVDGAFFNSGQSCCAIERIYVHEDVFDRFLRGATELTQRYILGNPLEPETTLGPMVHAKAAQRVRDQVSEALGRGARALIDEADFPASQAGSPYLAPQILVDVDHSMQVMVEESFGPVVGVMKVPNDEEAVRLMNDSPFGLTASVWTSDREAALCIGRQLDTGTFFMNRCDYLDPSLAWTGVKQSGHGHTLSQWGFEPLTRPKSYHMNP